MSAPPVRPEGLGVPRIALACVAGYDTVALAVETSTRPALALVACAGIVSLLLFARRPRTLVPGAVALAALAVLEAVGAHLAGGHQRVFFASGAALAGWVAGRVFVRAAWGPAPRAMRESTERIAERGALAALAATYVDAGLSKLLRSGAAWVDASSVRVAVLVNHPIDDASPLASYARFVVDHGALAQALSTATLVLELGAFVMVFAPRVRFAWAILLVGFHVNVALLTQDIFYVQACALLLAFAGPWTRRPRGAQPPEPPPDPERARAFGWRAARWVGAAVGAAWLVRFVAMGL
jgi:hypothetical protein